MGRRSRFSFGRMVGSGLNIYFMRLFSGVVLFLEMEAGSIFDSYPGKGQMAACEISWAGFDVPEVLSANREILMNISVEVEPF